MKSANQAKGRIFRRAASLKLRLRGIAAALPTALTALTALTAKAGKIHDRLFPRKLFPRKKWQKALRKAKKPARQCWEGLRAFGVIVTAVTGLHLIFRAIHGWAFPDKPWYVRVFEVLKDWIFSA